MDINGLDGRRVRAVFDGASINTLAVREIVVRNAMHLQPYNKNQCVLGKGDLSSTASVVQEGCA